MVEDEKDQLLTEKPKFTTEKSSIKRKIPFYWESCCFKCDPRIVVFLCQCIVSFFTLILCMFKLFTDDSCEIQSFYGNILMTMIGLWMPSPLVGQSKKE